MEQVTKPQTETAGTAGMCWPEICRKEERDRREEGRGISGNNGLLSGDSLGQEPRTGPTDAVSCTS